MRPNYKIYFTITFLSVLITVSLFFLKLDERSFSILSGISCGALSSTLVAFLIDISNCRIERTRANQMQKLYYIDLLNSYFFLLEMFMLFSKETHKEKRGWKEWLHLFLSNRTEGETKYILRHLEPVLDELKKIREQRIILISQQLLSYPEALILENVEEDLKAFKSGLSKKNGLWDSSLSETVISKWYGHANHSTLLKEFNTLKYNSPEELSKIIVDLVGTDTVLTIACADIY